ncbi:MAG: LAGLIDADG family homing endonuclease [Bacteroidota bacterium]
MCLAGDALVFDADTGAQVRIDELEGRVGNFYVQGVDEELRPQRAKVSHWVCNGEKPVVAVRLRSGATIKMTADHKVLTETGWHAIGDLSVGSHIATPRHLAVSMPQKADRDRLRVLAYLLADGALSSCGPTAEFVSKDDRLVAAYTESLRAFPDLSVSTLQQVREVTRVMVGGVNKPTYHSPNNSVTYLRELGLKDKSGGCRSHEKFIPDFVFGLEEADIAFFLAAYWDCDGYVGERHAHIKTISPYLAQGIQTLLLRLGIHSTVYESTYHSERHAGEMTAFQITVYDLSTLDQYLSQHLITKSIRPATTATYSFKDSLDRSTLLQELKQEWQGSQRGLMATTGFSRQHLLPSKTERFPRISKDVVSCLFEHLDLPKTRRNAQVRWEEIVAIEPAGQTLVYDITVDRIHNFVANNIIVHNCVYQEQVMLLSQKLAGFSKGEADMLRKAMGKKKKALLDKMLPEFIQGGEERGHPKDKLEKIWKDWEAFASYAFNKSHSTCYAFVAFQTAYLKAHYPAEFMAAVLTNSKSDISKITFFLQECKRMGLDVLGPDINESVSDFSVNPKGQVRFGMSALKGVGEGPVEAILSERAAGGRYAGVFDLLTRLDQGSINKRVLESLALGGAFDCFDDIHRAQYFAPSEKYDSFIEHLVKFSSAYHSQKISAATSLFGAIQEEVMVKEPLPPDCREWSLIEKLDKEKEVTGIFISGHPLDDYRMEIENFVSCKLNEVENHKHRSVLNLAGSVVMAQHRISKNGNGWGIFTVSDFDGELEFRLFGEDYQRFKHLLEPGKALFLKAGFQKSWRDDSLELKIKEVNLLESVGDTMTKGVTLTLPIDRLSPELVLQLEQLCGQHKGPHQLRMVLLDRQKRLKLALASKNRKVLVDNDFALELSRLGVYYRIDK